MPAVRPENFIAFFTICGFFSGIVFSILKTVSALDMLMYTLSITMIFYLLIHIIVINFIDVKKATKALFNQDEYEEISSYFIHELQEREMRMDALIDKNATHEPNIIKNFMEQDGVPKKKKAA